MGGFGGRGLDLEGGEEVESWGGEAEVMGRVEWGRGWAVVEGPRGGHSTHSMPPPWTPLWVCRC